MPASRRWRVEPVRSRMSEFPVALVIYWTLLIYLFSMDPGDSWMVVVILSSSTSSSAG